MTNNYQIKCAHLYAIRHGYYNEHGPDKQLNESGKEQAENLGSLIQKIHSGVGSVRIVTSPVLRARQTAEIIASRQKQAELLEEDMLQEAFWQPQVEQKIIPIVEKMSEGHHSIVIVGHNEVPLGITQHFAKKFGLNYFDRYGQVHPGEGFHIDMNVQDILRIRHYGQLTEDGERYRLQWVKL